MMSINLLFKQVSGSGLALAKVPVEQDAAYWEWHVHLPGLPPPQTDEDDDFHNVQMNGEEDPWSVKFGVATKKDRNFYRLSESAEYEEGTFDRLCPFE